MGQVLRKDGCTTIHENVTYAQLPPETKGYLTEKIEYALKNTIIQKVVKKGGKSAIVAFTQLKLSAAIGLDETVALFYWKYRPEVVFDMGPPGVRSFVPIPFLTAYTGTIDRRRSLNPFRKGSRRPDIIIVKNPAILWCGRKAKDHLQYDHIDNLLRVVEVKFPGDVLNPGQARDYELIAGSKNQFTVIDVSDCDDDIGKKKRAYEKKNVPVPVRTVKPIKEKLFYERWVVDPVQDAIHSLSQTANDLSNNIREYLEKNAPWLFEAGHWVKKKGSESWTYITEKGQQLVTWTKAQIQTALAEVERYTDMTIDVIKQINWYQVAIDAAKTVGVVVLIVAVAAVMACVSIPAGVVAAFTALVGIFSVSSASDDAKLMI
ncbi:VRR-NUC domain-containing protein [Acinetobacter sp. ESBL14]|uniref:VRR-NUC domain-containing protein n=1 Tax=Acinetobacter sp. ESBL14 TaxID=3077329 RepID=UPI002FC6BC02